MHSEYKKTEQRWLLPVWISMYGSTSIVLTALDNRFRDVVLAGGDFVWHVDDDDMAAPGAVAKIKKICRDKTTLYLFRMESSNKNECM